MFLLNVCLGVCLAYPVRSRYADKHTHLNMTGALDDCLSDEVIYGTAPIFRIGAALGTMDFAHEKCCGYKSTTHQI